MLPRKDGESLWWKVMVRGKRAITLKLSDERGRELLLRLAADVDVIIENFRPGTLERWRLGPDDLEAAGLDVVMLRISGFGQSGPYRDRPGYGTVAEAMSGLANLTGFPDGPPVFPSASLADGVSGLFGAMGVLAAMFGRQRRKGCGVEVVDVALFEALFRLIPTQVPVHDQLGTVLSRPGNFLGSHGVLRNLYQCRDGTYFCVSAIGDAPIRRLLNAIGADDLADNLGAALREGSGKQLEALLEEADERLRSWAGTRDYPDVDATMGAAGAVYQRVYSMADIAHDEQYRFRGDLIKVPDAKLGNIAMPAPSPKFSKHEHTVAHAGPALGEHTEEVLANALDVDAATIAELRAAGVI